MANAKPSRPGVTKAEPAPAPEQPATEHVRTEGSVPVAKKSVVAPARVTTKLPDGTVRVDH